MIEFWERYHDKVIEATIQHIQLVCISVSLALVLCVALFMLGRIAPKLNIAITTAINIVYTIPSMALFALCVPIVGIGRPAAILALTLYNMFVIYKNINMGFNSVDSFMIEAGTGIGLSNMQLFRYIQLPQTLPSVYAGLKLSSTMTVGLATIASIVSGGGLGKLLFDGLKRRFMEELFLATIISILMATAFNMVFQYLEDRALAKAKGEWEEKKNAKSGRRIGGREKKRFS